jgi:hypothetical protein
MPVVKIDIAAEYTGKKAFSQAEQATATLTKSVRTLASAFGLAFGTQAVIAFGKASVKAFSADEASAKRLTVAVDNLGIAFANPAIDMFIKNLESTAGIADDILRPAFQGLITTTGSLTASQKLLSDAITISRAKGVDLATVSQDLANGYVGITRGLKKYNTGLTQSELKTKSFSDILGILLKQSTGAANAYMDTTSFKFDVLGVAVDNAKEKIGKGLVDSFARMAGGTETSDAVKAIDNIASAINGISLATGTAIGGVTSILSLLKNLPKNIFQGFAGKAGGLPAPKATPVSKEELDKKKQREILAKLEKDAAKRAKELAAAQIKAQKALLEEQKRIALVKKAQGIFDLEQIQIAAALKGKISEEEKKRLELQAAIIGGNSAEIMNAANELSKVEGITRGLSIWLKDLPKARNPFEDWITYLDEAARKAALIAATLGMKSTGGGGGTDGGAGAGDTASTSTNVLPTLSSISSNAEVFNPNSGLFGAAGMFAPTNNVNVVVQLDGKTVGESFNYFQETSSQNGGSAGQWTTVRPM